VVEQIANDLPNRFAPLTMHVNGDPWTIPWGQHRIDVFYSLAGLTPTFMVDALWDCRPSDYRYYVEQQLAQPTDVTVELSGSQVSGDTWDVTARVCLEGSGSRPVRVFIAPTLDHHPELQEYSTNVLMQQAFETDITLPGNGCENATAQIKFDPVSMANAGDIVVIAWAQVPSASAPTNVYQAGIMRWPFPSGSQLTTIEVAPADIAMAVGEQISFTAVGKDQTGATIPLSNPMWSLGASGSGSGTFDPGSGSSTTTFTATASGSRQVFCQEGGVSGAALVTITEAPQLTTIEIDPASASVDVNGEVVFSATGKDQYGEEFPLAEPVWSVSGAGDGDFEPGTGVSTTFTATYPGACTISCAHGDVTGTAELEVTGEDPRLAAIELSPASVQTRVGDETEFVATGSDQYGRAFELFEPTWRIEGDGDGDFNPSDGSTTTTFTATGDGSAQIICSEDGIEGAAAVEIAPPGLPAPRKAGRRVVP
jgi:plastocyanin